MSRPLVTVYIPCHNYGHYLEEAVESVFAQNMDSWEVIIVDDGSEDDTHEICRRYMERAPDRVRVIRNEPAKGLQYNANRVIEIARGKYVIRLDSDDWLDESALLVMSACLEHNPDVALVFPNYYYVDANGDYLGVENRKKIGVESHLLDLPAHGACTMVRTRVLKTIGGYDEEHNAQDGYELWLKVFNRYPVKNVATPLFYYRQHADSLSRNEDRILTARQAIKRSMVQKQAGAVQPRVVAVVPAKNTYPHLPNIVLGEVAGRPLIDYTLDAALGSGQVDQVFVTTDDPAVVEYCKDKEGVLAVLRPNELSKADRKMSEVLYNSVQRLEEEFEFYADIIVTLSLHSPLRKAMYIVKALDTLVLYDADSVISVYEDYDMHFSHGTDGLEPLNPAMMRRIRLEREGLYVYNGSITASWRDVMGLEDYHGVKISHVVMPQKESFQIKSAFDLWLMEQILRR
ncbi:MAG: glycosyltransferase family 2 protein [Bradymonadaceae bacterium]